jgi:BlaI family transcriptional regulator, penicillinase repressor
MPPAELHALESEVMEEIWARDGCTVRDVHEALNARDPTQRAYTTILTVMQRLHAKGLLRRAAQGRGHVYRPALTREEYAQERAEAQVEDLVSRYGDVALAHFARHMSGLDAKRREQIRRLARGG